MGWHVSDSSAWYHSRARMLPVMWSRTDGSPWVLRSNVRFSLNTCSIFASRHFRFSGCLGLLAATLGVYITGVIHAAHGSSASASPHASWPHPPAGRQVVQGHVRVPPQYLADLRLTLNGGLLSVAPSSSGEFEIGPLHPGSYLLQPSHPLLHLSSYSIKVPASSSEALQVFALGDSFRPVVKLQLPLVIAPLGLNPPLYFATKPPFSLLVLLQQPLLLVAIACCALMWCLPRLQQYQEEDERQQRAALMQQQELLAQNNFPRIHRDAIQERYDSLERTRPVAAAWGAEGRGRQGGDVDHREAEGDQSEDYVERSAFSKCLASIHSTGRSHR